MTQQHPITPPPELVQHWSDEALTASGMLEVKKKFAALAAQWGADTELEACCALLEVSDDNARDFLQSARRPKLPSLKEQALEAMREMQIEPCIINGVDTNAAVRAKYEIIRRALEQLPQ